MIKIIYKEAPSTGFVIHLTSSVLNFGGFIVYHPVSKKLFKFDFKGDIPHKCRIHTFSSMNIWTRGPLHSEDNINGLLTHASSKSGREDRQMLAFGWTLYYREHVSGKGTHHSKMSFLTEKYFFSERWTLDGLFQIQPVWWVWSSFRSLFPKSKSAIFLRIYYGSP